MTLPGITGTVVDGALGLAAAAPFGPHVAIGVCSAGTANAITSVSDPADVVSALGYGPLARKVAHALGSVVADTQQAPSPVYAVRVTPTTAGLCGDVVKTAAVGLTAGTGTITVAGAAYDRFDVVVEILTAGTLGAGVFRYSLDGGNAWSVAITIPGGATYLIAEANVTLTFVPGGGAVYFQDGDTHAFVTRAPQMTTSDLVAPMAALLADARTWRLAHVVQPITPAATAVTSAGTTPPVITITGTPTDYFNVKVKCTLLGARGTWTLQYSLDGGTTYNGTDLTSAATVAIPRTGLTLNIATGAAAVDNTWTFNTGASASLAAWYNAIKTYTETAETAKRPTLFLIEAGDAPDADLITAAAALSACPRVAIAAGFCDVSSPLDARLDKRSAGWPIAARLAAIPPGRKASRRASGPLARVDALHRDERATEGLWAAKFSVLQTDLGNAGEFFVTEAQTVAATGSDFGEVQRRFVMDVAEAAAFAALKRFEDDEVRVNATTGLIDEVDARRVENYVRAQVAAQLLTRPDASAVTCQTIRTDNLLTTETLRVRLRIVPLGYAKYIELTVGFENPALVAA